MKAIAKSFSILTFLVLVQCDEPNKATESARAKPKVEEITFVTKVATDAEIQIVRFSIKDGKGLTRMEDPRFTTIHDPDKGVYLLDHHLKKFRHITSPEIPDKKPETETTEHERKQYAIIEKAAKMAYSGKERLIGEWRCREFVVWDSYGTGVPSQLESSIIAWIAEDFENGKELQRLKSNLAPLPLVSRFSKISGKDFQLPGLALETIVRQSDGLPEVYTLVEITGESPSKDAFEIPSGYTAADE